MEKRISMLPHKPHATSQPSVEVHVEQVEVREEAVYLLPRSFR